MKWLKLNTLCCSTAILIVITGCATQSRTGKKPLTKPAATPSVEPSYWNDTGVTGEPKIVISISQQRAYFYKGSKVVGEAKISSGRKGFDTPPGPYAVIQKDKDHVSNLYGDFVDEFGDVVKSNVDITKDPPPEGTAFSGSKMPYFLRFHQGYGIHAGRLPGRRASHGCIRVSHAMAEHFYNNAPAGTPVIVEE